jgi:hypothetical protein
MLSFWFLTFVDCIVSEAHLIHTHAYVKSGHMLALSVPHPKEKLAQYIRRTYSR